MSTAQTPIKLYETVIDDCPYLEDQQSASILVDPEHPISSRLFALLSRSGFRRSGDMVYAPKCPTCKACVSVRIPVTEFKPSRNQKRVLNKNKDLRVELEDISFQEEHFDLYLKYQQSRHPDSSMCDTDSNKYLSFIDSRFSQSKFLCLYENKSLLGVCVLDQFEGGLSAVYTFFDPAEAKRSLGTFAILKLISLASSLDISHVYLGYWIKNSQKMSYKSNFRPLEGFINKRWESLNFED